MRQSEAIGEALRLAVQIADFIRSTKDVTTRVACFDETVAMMNPKWPDYVKLCVENFILQAIHKEYGDGR